MKYAVETVRSYAEDFFSDRRNILKIMSIILILLIAVIFRLHDASEDEINVDAIESKSFTDEICVDIGGAVSLPGVYKVKPDTRLFELIEMAGGLSENADTDSINQAAYVEDGQKIIIPVKHAAGEPSYDADTSDSAEQYTSDAPSVSGLVNINTAGKDELKSLNGIGDVMAERIIEYRSGNLFKSKEDIKSVKGIGNATYDKIKDMITV